MPLDPSVSVVIPAYNAVGWITETVRRAVESFQRAGLANVEFLVVDDGSADGTAAVAEAISAPYPVHVVRCVHRGRFATRKEGVLRAAYDHILFLDARVHLHPGSMGFVAGQLASHSGRVIWNAHVAVAKQGNVVGRFGDALTRIAWRRYFSRPRVVSYGLAEFDHYPKGTTCFFVPKALLSAAIEEFETTTYDLEHSSDDTLLIRILAHRSRICVSPLFSCTYHPRTTLRQFAAHSYHRGQFLVDGFLRPGTRFYRPLVGFLLLSAAGLLILPVVPGLLPATLLAAAAVWLAEPLVALALGTSARDALSLFVLSPAFALCYGLGIWRAVLRRSCRRRAEPRAS